MKTQERTASLRKEVYLDAAKKMPAALSSLINFSDREESMIVSPDLSDFFSTAAQIQLVAEPMTASLVRELVSKYSDLMKKSSFTREGLGKAISDRNKLEKKRDNSRLESERLLMEINKLKGISSSDSILVGAVTESYKLHIVEAEKAELELSDAEVKIAIERFRLLKSLLPDVKEISEFQNVVLVGIRKDLGLTSNVKLMELQVKRDLAAIEHLIKFLGEIIEKHHSNND